MGEEFWQPLTMNNYISGSPLPKYNKKKETEVYIFKRENLWVIS